MKFCYDFYPELRPTLFDNSFVDDPMNMTYFKISSKNRYNKIDTDHSSKLLMERSLNRDRLNSAKLGYIHTKVNEEGIYDNLLIKASTEISSNHQDLLFLKNQFFLRYIVPVANFKVQSSIKAAYIKNLKNNTSNNFD